MNVNLDELMRLRESATPGPWKVATWYGGYHTVRPKKDPEKSMGQIELKADAAYIVAACNAVPELVARIRALETQRDWLAGIASHYTDRTNCYNPFAYNGVDNACLKDCRDRDCKKCWLVAAKEYTQFSALDTCRIVSNNNSIPPEWLMRRFTEVN